MENTYNFVSVKNKNVRYLGRWTVDSLARSYFQSGVEFYFTGKLAGVDVLCEGRDCALTVSVDNEKSFVVPYRTDGVLLLADNLGKGIHHIAIHADFQEKLPVFKAFVLNEGGETVQGKKRPSIEFIGDSITVGYVRDGIGSTSLTFCDNVARQLDCAYSILAYGGITMTERPTAADCTGMINRYFKLGPICAGEAQNIPWDIHNYIPDNVVISLGTNDWDDSWDKTGYYDRFEGDYISFIKRLKQVYTDTRFFVSTPYDVIYKKNAEKIRNIVKSFDEVILLEAYRGIKPQMFNAIDHVHINETAHSIVADNFASEIKKYGKF